MKIFYSLESILGEFTVHPVHTENCLSFLGPGVKCGARKAVQKFSKCLTSKFYLDGSLGSVVMVGGRNMFTEDAEDIPNVTEAAVDAAVKARRARRRRRAAAASAEQVRPRTPRRRRRPP